MLSRLTRLVLATSCLVTPTLRAAPPPSAEEMWQIIQEQQKQIEALKEQLETTNQKVKETDEKVEVAGEMIEEAGSKVPTAASWAEKTKIGGYGELHYNNLDSKEEVDFKRFVLYFGHEFTDFFYQTLRMDGNLIGRSVPFNSLVKFFYFSLHGFNPRDFGSWSTDF